MRTLQHARAGNGRRIESSEESRGVRSSSERPSSERLLASYRKKPTARVRELILDRHRPDVEAMARALAARLPRSVDVDDLVHAGIWGLMQAIDKFRADRGVPFRPFMRPRVRGAMLDELRSLDYLPRLWRRRARALDKAVGELRGILGREPRDSELAARLGTTEVWLRRARTRVHDGSGESGDRRARSDGADPFDDFADQHNESPLDALDRRELIAAIESSLQPVEWKVLRMHYLEGLTGKEVAARLRLSAARICQIHGKVLLRLKARFASRAI